MAAHAHELTARLRQLSNSPGDIALAQSIARTLLHDDPVALQLLDTHAPTPVSVQQHSVESGAPCAPALSLPVGVQAHYVKALLDWAVSQLVRQQPQQQKQKKAKDGALPAPESEQQQAQQQNGHPRERPAAWDLLAALLACKWSGLASSSAVPPSILASVGAACQHAAGLVSTEPRDAVQLLSAVDRALRLLLQLPQAGAVPGGRNQQQQQQQQQPGGKRRQQARLTAVVPSIASGSFLPNLDQCVALVAALLEHLVSAAQAASTEAAAVWRSLMLACLQLLQAIVHGLPNTKKVFTSVLTRLYAPLAALVFHVLPVHAADSSSLQRQDSSEELRVCALQLLESVLMHESHLPGLIELADLLVSKKPDANGADPAAAVTPGTPAKEQDAQEQAKKKKKRKAEASAPEQEDAAAEQQQGPGQIYQMLLAQVVQESVANVLSPSSGAVPQLLAQGVLSSLPWLLERFSVAVARLRQLAAADAASSSWAARSSGKQQGQEGRQRAQEQAVGADGSDAAASLQGAEFKLYTALAAMLVAGAAADSGFAGGAAEGAATGSAGGKVDGALSRATPVIGAQTPAKGRTVKRARKEQQQQQQQQQAEGGQGRSWSGRAVLLSSLGALLGAVKATSAYQPTRDLSGAQRATLQQAADAAISCFEAAIADEGALAAGGQEQGAAAAEVLAQLLPACCSAICAVLDLDHRTLQAHLDQVWQLLWATAAVPCRDGGPQPAVIASRAGCRLITAYQELRQLSFLVASLLKALRVASAAEEVADAQGNAPTARGLAHLGLDVRAAAAAVVRQPLFTSALHNAVRHIPPGQCPAIVELVAHDVAAWMGGQGCDTSGSSNSKAVVLLAVGKVYSTCLSALRVDLTTAVPVATAVQQLLGSCVAGPMAQALSAACCSSTQGAVGPAADDSERRKSKKRQKRLSGAVAVVIDAGVQSDLALLLQLYSGLVRLHSLCASMHPEVTFLPDQGPSVAATATQPQSSSYFAATLGNQQDAANLPADPLPLLAPHMAAPLQNLAQQDGHAGSVETASASDLHAATGFTACLHSVTLQRLQMLDEQISRLSCNCRVTTTASKGLEDDGAGPVGDQGAAAKALQAAKQEEAGRLTSALLAPLLARGADAADLFRLMAGVSAEDVGHSGHSSSTSSSAANGSCGLTQCDGDVAGASGPGYLPGASQTAAIARYVCSCWQRCLSSAASWVNWAQPQDLSQIVQLMITACCLDQPAHESEKGAQAGSTLHSNDTTSGSAGVSHSCLSRVASGSRALLGLVEFTQLAPVQAALPGAVAQLVHRLIQQAMDLSVDAKGQQAAEEGGDKKRKKHRRDSEGREDAQDAQGSEGAAGQHSEALTLTQQLAEAVALETASGSGSSGQLRKQLGTALRDQCKVLHKYVDRYLQQQHGNEAGGKQRDRRASHGQGAGVSLCSATLQQLCLTLDLARALPLACLTTLQLAQLADFCLSACTSLVSLLQQLLIAGKRQQHNAGQVALAALQSATMLAAETHALLASRAAHSTAQVLPGCTAAAEPQSVLSWTAALCEVAGVMSLQAHAPGCPPAGDDALPGTGHANAGLHKAMTQVHSAAQLMKAVSGCAWAMQQHSAAHTNKDKHGDDAAEVGREDVEAWWMATASELASKVDAASNQSQGSRSTPALTAYAQAHLLSVLSASMADAVSRPSVGRKRAQVAAHATAALARRLHDLGQQAARSALQVVDTATALAADASTGAFLLQQTAGALLEVCGNASVQQQQASAAAQQQQQAAISTAEPGSEAVIGDACEHKQQGSDDEELAEQEQGHMRSSALGELESGSIGGWDQERELLLAGVKLVQQQRQAASDSSLPFPEAATLLALRLGRLLGALCAAAPAACRAQPDGGKRLLLWLLQLHLELLPLLSPSSVPPTPQPGGAWGVMASDVPEAGPTRAVRLALMHSLRLLLQGCGRVQLLQVVRSVTQQLAESDNATNSSSRPLASTSDAEAAVLLPKLQTLFLTLEEASTPHVLAVLASQAPAATSALLQLMPVLQLQLQQASAQALGPDAPQHPSTQASAAAASICCLLRCLESVAGREKTFQLGRVRVVSMVSGVAALFPWSPASPSSEHELAAAASTAITGDGDLALQHGVFCSAASLLACLMRHRSESVQRAMPVIAQAAAGMLQALVRWGSVHSTSSPAAPTSSAAAAAGAAAALLRCSIELARVYESAAGQDKRRVSKYCMRMLGDYIIAIASHTPEGVLARGASEGKAALPSAAATALQQGVFHLLACLSAGELQHLHVALGPGVGGARRTALAALRSDYEKSFKYEGKV